MKIVLCLLFAVTLLYTSAGFRADSLYSYTVSESSEAPSEKNRAFYATDKDTLEFVFKPTLENLSYVGVFIWNFEAEDSADMVCVLRDCGGETVKTVRIPLSLLRNAGVCKINFDTPVTPDAEYSVEIKTDKANSAVGIIMNLIGEDEESESIDDYAAPLTVSSYSASYAPMHTVFYVFKLLFAMALLSLAVYSVFNFEKLYSFFIATEKKQGALLAAVLSAVAVFMSDPLSPEKLEISGAVGQIGFGVSRNYDYNAAITELTCVLAVAVISFALLFLLFNKLFAERTDEENRGIYKLINSFSIVALSYFALYAAVFFAARERSLDSFSYSTALIALISVYLLLYPILGMERRISHKAYINAFFAIFAASFLLCPLLSAYWSGGRMSVILLTVMLAAYIGVLYIKGAATSKILASVSDRAAHLVCAAPLFISLFTELLHILNQNKVFVKSPTAAYLTALSAFLCISALLVFLGIRFDKRLFIPNRVCMPLLLLGLAFLSVQPAFSQTVNVNMFENANFSVLASDFVNSGKIPFVEHYGAHMLESVPESISWLLLNGTDTLLANPYIQSYLGIESVKVFTPAVILIAYFFLRMCCDEREAFFISLLLPVVNIFGYFAAGLLPLFAISAYIKKRTPQRALAIWLACAVTALFRLDLGMSFGVAAVVTVLLLLVRSRSKKEGKTLLLSFILVIASFGILWLLLCLLKDINPIERLREFLAISLSNYNWAYEGLGNKALPLFAAAYLILPLLVALTLLYTLFSRKGRELSDAKKSVMVFLAIAYFANFSRSCVRHTVGEMSVHVIVWTSLLLAAALVCQLFDKRTLTAPVLSAGLIISVLLGAGLNTLSGNTLSGISSSYGNAVSTWQMSGSREELTYWEELRESETVVERVELTGEAKEIYYPCRDLFSELLEEGETFLDFANVSHLYAMLGIESPVYVSQSPLQLTDELSRRLFVEQIKSNMENIPFAFLPYSENASIPSFTLDAIPNSYRYAEVSEFIYENYIPVCEVGGLSLWARTDVHPSALASVEELNKSEKHGRTYQIIENYIYDSEKPSAFHLGSLPYLFGKYEKPDGESEYASVSPYDGTLYEIGASSNESCVYLKFTAEYNPSAASNSLTEITLRLGGLSDEDELRLPASVIILDVREGVNTYYVRISCDYAWQMGEITHLDFETDGSVICRDISLVTFGRE